MSATAADAVTSVEARSTATTGRYVVSAGTRHFVSDARAASGGPGEAVTAGELLLAALASCALAVIQQHARELGVALPAASTDVQFKRDAQDGTRYEYIRLRADLPGVPRVQAQALLERFTATCPIYNTLRRGGTVYAELADGTAAA